MDKVLSKEKSKGAVQPEAARSSNRGEEPRALNAEASPCPTPTLRSLTIDEYTGQPPGSFAQFVKDNPDPDALTFAKLRVVIEDIRRIELGLLDWWDSEWFQQWLTLARKSYHGTRATEHVHCYP